MRPADRLHSLLSESRPFLYFHAPRFNEFPFAHFSTSKRGLVYSSIIFLRAFFVQSRAEHFWKRVLSDSREGKILIGHTTLVEGRLLAWWVYWETLGIYYAEGGFSEGGGGIKFENGEIVASSQKVKVEFLT